ncbi:hypothetical protein C7459_1203 [Tumebacillus permanentifrigoris]|uniref:Uncharacterized protein n=1 Tax=Tumebacillus permanentifrigoris TaxID=378543 RepID=A0A316D3N9_9BACL|nr:hypothetical protein C7459_1203 [Tumebacillus permanentifrigoris]
MPSCDFGRPCDCRDCKRIDYTIICPHCYFENVVSVDGIAKWETDRKGYTGVSLTKPDLPFRDLNCYSCKTMIRDAGVFDNIRIEVMERNLGRQRAIEQGRVCVSCRKVEGYDGVFWERDERYKEKDGKKYCTTCLSKILEKETPNPSDTESKYEFDKSRLEWVLRKVRQPCIRCQKKRWLNVENTWKKQCSSCYSSTR